MSLSNYRDARAWGRAIREELVEQRMPPSPVAPGYGRFQNDPSLTAREMMTMLDGGMPRGDESDLPPRGAANAKARHVAAGGSVVNDAAGDRRRGGITGAPGADADDLRIELPPQDVPAGEDLIGPLVAVDAGRAAAYRTARVVFVPGDRRVFRGALVYATAPTFGGAGPFVSGSAGLPCPQKPWRRRERCAGFGGAGLFRPVSAIAPGDRPARPSAFSVSAYG